MPFCGILKAGFWNSGSPENENFLHCRNTVRKSEMKDTLALKPVEKARYSFRRTLKNVLMKCIICFFRLISTEIILNRWQFASRYNVYDLLNNEVYLKEH